MTALRGVSVLLQQDLRAGQQLADQVIPIRSTGLVYFIENQVAATFFEPSAFVSKTWSGVAYQPVTPSPISPRLNH